MACEETKPTRSQREIQLAHDRLALALNGRVPNPFADPVSEILMRWATNVLCWVLQHQSPEFEANLEQLERAMKEAGFHLS